MKTLFRRLLITYITIILIGFVVLTITMSQSFERYFIDQREALLINQAKSFEEEYRRAFRTGVVDLDKMDFEIQALGKYLNTRIWLINTKGQIFVSSRVEDISMIEEELKYSEVKSIFNGEIIKREGYFQNFFDEPVLTIGYPIKINDKVMFALFMHASIPEINRTTSDIYRIALISLVISTLIAIVLVFIVSRKMTNQIKDLNNAVKIISKGNFEKRLRVNSKDEFGQLAQNVNEMAEELNKQEEKRRRFISNLSHDIRTPLTSINGFVNGILDGTIEKGRERRYLKIVAEESERLKKLTNDILDLSKMEGGELELDIASFNISEALLNEIDKFEKSIVEKGVKVSIKLDKNKSMVKGDITQIKRVINNLIDNAVKFVNEEGYIDIETHYYSGKIHISIGNTGGTLSKEDISRMWERFNKLDNSRSKDKIGSGLGLSIVKEILKAHNEDIEVVSNNEVGVKFTFSLPI